MELYLSRQDGRHVIRIRNHVLELDDARALLDHLADAIDLHDAGETEPRVLSAGELEVVFEDGGEEIRVWREVLDIDGARDLLDALGEQLDTADDLELAELPDAGDEP